MCVCVRARVCVCTEGARVTSVIWSGSTGQSRDQSFGGPQKCTIVLFFEIMCICDGNDRLLLLPTLAIMFYPDVYPIRKRPYCM